MRREDLHSTSRQKRTSEGDTFSQLWDPIIAGSYIFIEYNAGRSMMMDRISCKIQKCP